MIKPNDYIEAVDQELRRAGAITKVLCESFADLPVETQIVLARAMAFAGCETEVVLPEAPPSTLEVDRITASRLMLLKLQVHTDDPRWSSWMLGRMLEAVVQSPGGNVGDLFHALYDMLGECSCALSGPVASFITDVVVGCFTQHRASYESAHLGWMVEKVINTPTSAQAYFALHAIPPGIMPPKAAVSILRSLAGSPYWKNALNTLAEDLGHEEARVLLAEWLAEGVPPPCAKDIQRILA